MTPAPTIIDPAELTIHPSLKLLPEESLDGEEFNLFLEDVRERGIQDPLIIDGENRVMSGRRRYRAAKRLQLTEVSVIVRPTTEAASIILGALLHRKHLTKSARAYLAYPLMKAAHEQAQRRRYEKLKKGQQFSEVHGVHDGEKEDTVEGFAASVGISRRLFFNAAQVHDIFCKSPEYKALMEPRILAEPIGGEHEDLRPVGLGAVIAGYGGQKATRDHARQDHAQLDLFENAVYSTFQRFAKLDDVSAIRPVIKGAIEKLDDPEELAKLLTLATEIETQVKARTKALGRESAR